MGGPALEPGTSCLYVGCDRLWQRVAVDGNAHTIPSEAWRRMATPDDQRKAVLLPYPAPARQCASRRATEETSARSRRDSWPYHAIRHWAAASDESRIGAFGLQRQRAMAGGVRSATSREVDDRDGRRASSGSAGEPCSCAPGLRQTDPNHEPRRRFSLIQPVGDAACCALSGDRGKRRK
jgi:hypothetical protein